VPLAEGLEQTIAWHRLLREERVEEGVRVVA
jgi:hypothetical protein